LLNQRQLFARLTGGAVEADPQVDLQRITLGIRDVLDRARDLERDAHRYWALRWLALREAETFAGEVRLDPQTLDGTRPPRVLVGPVAVLLPLEGADRLLSLTRDDAAGSSPRRPDTLRLRVRVEVLDVEALSARAVLVEG
jgi:exoribonuclease R